jgi:hypothetical protein
MQLEEPDIATHVVGVEALVLPKQGPRRVATLLAAAIDSARETAVNPQEDPGVVEQMTRVMPEIATILDRDFGIVR